jgi:metal-sulfur cluster biosynthetic enzyme
MAGATPTKAQVIDVLRGVMDPELGVDVISLGLVYKLDVSDDGAIDVIMTLTTPGCPLHAIIGRSIERAMLPLGVSDVQVHLVFSPPWDPRMMNDHAREELGMQ